MKAKLYSWNAESRDCRRINQVGRPSLNFEVSNSMLGSMVEMTKPELKEELAGSKQGNKGHRPHFAVH